MLFAVRSLACSSSSLSPCICDSFLNSKLSNRWLHVHLQVSIDLFVTARQSVDLASLADLCGPTGGQLYHYCPFMSPSDDDQLYNDLRWNVQRPQVSS